MEFAYFDNQSQCRDRCRLCRALNRKLLRFFAVFLGLVSGNLSPFPIGRAEPYHRQHQAKLFKLQTAVGTAIGSFVVSTTLFWVSRFALLATLAQSGCRKSEVAVLSACLRLEW